VETDTEWGGGAVPHGFVDVSGEHPIGTTQWAPVIIAYTEAGRLYPLVWLSDRLQLDDETELTENAKFSACIIRI